MASPLHHLITTSCLELLEELTTQRAGQTIDPTQYPISSTVSKEELALRIQAIIGKARESINLKDGTNMDPDILKSHLEVSGREVTLQVADEELSLESTDGAAKWRFMAKLYDVCDIVRVLFMEATAAFSPMSEVSKGVKAPTPKWDPIIMFLAIVDELVELLSIDSWNVFLGYFESRQNELTGGQLLSGVRALYFLRPLNSLLRITSRSSHVHPSTTFATFDDYLDSTSSAASPITTLPRGSTSEVELRGRIHIFMAGLFRISDQSATNSRGAYADMLLPYDEDWSTTIDNLRAEIEPQDEDHEMAVPEKKESIGVDEIYDGLCVLQRFFSNPVSITSPATESGRSGLEDFKRRVETITSAFASHAVRASSNVTDVQDIFVTRYVPSRNAAEFQITEPDFRRQICVQLLIMLQQIQNLHVKDKSRHPKDLHFPATFSVETEDYEWARKQSALVQADIVKMPNGRDFDTLISSMLASERNHAMWKHVGCSPFEREVMSQEEIEKDIANAEKRRQAIIAPLPPFAHAAGTKALSQLSRNPLTSVEQLKTRKVTVTIKDLQAKWNDVDFDEGMGGTPREFLEQKASLSWRALRLVLEQDFDVLEKLKDKYDPNEIIKLQEALSKETVDAAQPIPSAPNTPNAPQVATFAGDSDTDTKKIKQEVNEAMPLLDKEAPLRADTAATTNNDAPEQDVASSDIKPNLPVELTMPVGPTQTADGTAKAADDVDMK